MSNSENQRVLNRMGARDLTEQELITVMGAGPVTTFVCTFDPRTGSRDGDCD